MDIREQEGWPPALPLEMVILFGASHTPRRWSPGRRPAHARKPHFYREPSLWLSHPALITTYDTDDAHISASGLDYPDFRLVYTAGYFLLNMVKACSLSSSKPESLSLSCSVNGCSILSAPQAKNLVSPLIPFSLTHIEASGNSVDSTFKMRKRN